MFPASKLKRFLGNIEYQYFIIVKYIEIGHRDTNYKNILHSIYFSQIIMVCETDSMFL